MRRLVLIGSAIIAACVVAGLIWWLLQPKTTPQELVLYGNVDLREVDLAFNNNERIAAVLVQEGDQSIAGRSWRASIRAGLSRKWRKPPQP